MAWFDDVSQEDPSGRQAQGDTPYFGNPNYVGKQDPQVDHPVLPTVDTTFGTPSGQPDPNYASGSPYFGLGGTLPQNAPFPNASLGWGADGPPQPPSTVGAAGAGPANGAFDWSGIDDLISQVGQFGSLNTPYPEFTQQMPGFDAPNGANESNDPGYQAREAMGEQAINRSAAAQGNLLTGATVKGLQKYGQDYASSEYDKIYNHALASYQANLSDYNSNRAAYEANRQDYNTRQQNTFNQAFGLAGLGLRATEDQSGAGTSYGNNLAQIYASLGGSLSDLYTNQGNSNASGAIASGNAGASAVNSLGNLANTAILGQAFKTPTAPPPTYLTPPTIAAPPTVAQPGAGVTYNPSTTSPFTSPASQSTYNPYGLHF